MYTQDQGNNETISRGTRCCNGRWLALTFTESKWFATEKGAAKWLARRGYNPDGSRVGK